MNKFYGEEGSIDIGEKNSIIQGENSVQESTENIQKDAQKILSRNEIEQQIYEESQEKIQQIFGSKLEFSFICGGLASGYWENTHDIDFFICINGPMSVEEETQYLNWYNKIHKKYGLSPDIDYPGEIIEKDKLIQTFGKLHDLELTLEVYDVMLKKAIIWCDMLTGNIKAISGNNLEILELLRERYINEPSKWKKQLLSLIPSEEVADWEEKSHTLIMEHYMKYPKGDGRTKREEGYYNVQDNYESDPVLIPERFEPIQWCNSIENQIDVLKNIFPGIIIDQEYVNQKNTAPLKKGYSRVVIPKLSYYAKLLGINSPYENIGEIMEYIGDLIGQSRPFTNYRRGELGKEFIQFDKKTADDRSMYEVKIAGEVMIIDVSLGEKYTGFSPRRAKADIQKNENRIALSSVDIGMILLLNPKRISSDIDLSIDSCAETYFSQTRGWVSNLFFYYRKSNGELSEPIKNLEFGYRWNKRPYSDAGAAYFLKN